MIIFFLMNAAAQWSLTMLPQGFRLLVGAAGKVTCVTVLSQQSQLESLAICTENCVAVLQLGALCWEVSLEL